MDNFMKNKEMLKNRELSSDMRININQSDGTSKISSAYDKLNDMKKRLDQLRSQKFN
jgi:hypothetical protein